MFRWAGLTPAAATDQTPVVPSQPPIAETVPLQPDLEAPKTETAPEKAPSVSSVSGSGSPRAENTTVDVDNAPVGIPTEDGRSALLPIENVEPNAFARPMHIISQNLTNHPPYEPADDGPLTPRTDFEKRMKGMEDLLRKTQDDSETHLAHVSETLRRMLENMNKHVDRLEERIKTLETYGGGALALSGTVATAGSSPDRTAMTRGGTMAAVGASATTDVGGSGTFDESGHAGKAAAYSEDARAKHEALELGLTPNENQLFGRKKGQKEKDAPKAYVAVKDDVAVHVASKTDSQIQRRLKTGEVVKPTGNRVEEKGRTMLQIEAESAEKKGGWVDRAFLKETQTKKSVRLGGKLMQKGEDASNKIGAGFITSYTSSSCHATRNTWISHNESYKFRPSVWDMSIFAFIGLWSSKVSVFTLFVFLVNALCQLIMVLYIGAIYTNGELTLIDQNTVDSVTAWRHTVAHDAKWLDPVTQESLARKVCNRHSGLHMSGKVQDTLAMVLSYQPDAAFFDDASMSMHFTGQWQGVLVCLLALLIWWNTCIVQVRNAISCFVAIKNMPKWHGESVFLFFREDYELEAHEGGILQLQSLNHGRKRWGYLVCMMRLLLALLLLAAGSLYLIYTVNLENLLVNAIALVFVINLDEVMFQSTADFHSNQFIECLAPVSKPSYYIGDCICCRPRKRHVKADIEEIDEANQLQFAKEDRGEDDGAKKGRKPDLDEEEDEVRRPKPKGAIKSIEIRSCFIFLVALGMVGGSAPFLLKEMDLHKQVRLAICGDYLDFVFAFDQGGAIAAHPTKVMKDARPIVPELKGSFCPIAAEASKETYAWDAVDEIIKDCHKITTTTENSLSLTAAGLGGSVLSLGADNELLGDKMSRLNPSCGDAFTNANSMAWKDEFLTQMMPFQSCSGVTGCNWDNATGMAYRQWCSETCGCSAPNSSLVLSRMNMGCPNTCFTTAAGGNYTKIIEGHECADVKTNSTAMDEYIEGVQGVRDSFKYYQEWSLMMDKWIVVLKADGCKGHVLKTADDKNAMGDLCFGENFFKLKPLIFLCPVQCGCPGGKKKMPFLQPELCPLKCANYTAPTTEIGACGNGTNGSNGSNGTNGSNCSNASNASDTAGARRARLL